MAQNAKSKGGLAACTEQKEKNQDQEEENRLQFWMQCIQNIQSGIWGLRDKTFQLVCGLLRRLWICPNELLSKRDAIDLIQK